MQPSKPILMSISRPQDLAQAIKEAYAPLYNNDGLDWEAAQMKPLSLPAGPEERIANAILAVKKRMLEGAVRDTLLFLEDEWTACDVESPNEQVIKLAMAGFLKESVKNAGDISIVAELASPGIHLPHNRRVLLDVGSSDPSETSVDIGFSKYIQTTFPDYSPRHYSRAKSSHTDRTGRKWEFLHGINLALDDTSRRRERMYPHMPGSGLQACMTEFDDRILVKIGEDGETLVIPKQWAALAERIFDKKSFIPPRHLAPQEFQRTMWLHEGTLQGVSLRYRDQSTAWIGPNELSLLTKTGSQKIVLTPGSPPTVSAKITV